MNASDASIPTAVVSAPARSQSEPVHGPVPFFDLHLRVLSESYISFFQERHRIEEIYTELLQKLHARATIVDNYFDERTDSSSVRKSWREIRDNLDREAQSHVAFMNTLKTDVLTPLASLKDTQERTRKRIKEDLKDSVSAHADYAENVLPRYKRAYIKRCQEVEDYKVAPITPSTGPPPSSPFIPPQASDPQAPPPPSNKESNPLKQTLTAPTPSLPTNRVPSTGSAGPRTRSPSTSTAFSEIAHQGKKGLNQIMNFLGEGGKPGIGTEKGFTGRSEGALRNVRAKREADDADKEYRKGIHWLETLRIRRVKILEGGYKSLEEFVYESADTMKKVLTRYADNMAATSASNTQFIAHAQTHINQINPTKDVTHLHSLIPRSLALASPKQVLYHNYAIGDCSDLLFGVGLVDYANARALGEKEIPRLIRLCINDIEARGLEAEGIYRISGRHAAVQDITHRIERNERAFEFNHQTDDVYCVSGVLKLYLRELPEPVFRFPIQERIQHTEHREEHFSNDFRVLRAKIRRLPIVHQATLKALIEHLALIASRSGTNKMDPKNLSIVFGSVIFGEDDLPKGADILSMQNWKDTVLEDLIMFASTLFDDRAVTSSPPLPAPPEGESSSTYDYGSAFTKVNALPSTGHRQAGAGTSAGTGEDKEIETTAISSATQDFIPQLPPRPSQTIQPSKKPATSAPGDPTEHPLPVTPKSPTSALPQSPTKAHQRGDKDHPQNADKEHPSKVDRESYPLSKGKDKKLELKMGSEPASVPVVTSKDVPPRRPSPPSPNATYRTALSTPTSPVDDHDDPQSLLQFEAARRSFDFGSDRR